MPDLGPDSSNVQVLEDGSSFLLLNEVAEDGFSSSVLPSVRLLARWSAAWQFKVIPDPGLTSCQGQKVFRLRRLIDHAFVVAVHIVKLLCRFLLLPGECLLGLS
jgi:hypothetical protein